MTVPVEALLGIPRAEALKRMKRMSEVPDLVEAYEERLHPRGRLGRWVHVLRMPKPGYSQTVAPGVYYRESHKVEATNDQHGTHGVIVGPKFFDLKPEQRRNVLAHEIGHDFDQKLLTDPETAWVWDEHEWHDAAGVPLNGPGASPGERIADAIAAILTDDREAIERWPAIRRLGQALDLTADDDPIDVGDDVERAAQLLAEGKRVVLNQPRQVSTLLDRLAEIVREAREKGENAPNFDLCKVSVKGTNLFCVESKGIPRVEMPQFKGTPVAGSRADRELVKNQKGRVSLDDAWREHLRGLGVTVERETEKAAYLRATQRELNGANVARIAHEIEAGRATLPIFVSRDNYILDGHHQWAATIGAGARENLLDADMPIERIDLPITDLIEEARKFVADWGMAAQSVTLS